MLAMPTQPESDVPRTLRCLCSSFLLERSKCMSESTTNLLVCLLLLLLHPFRTGACSRPGFNQLFHFRSSSRLCSPRECSCVWPHLSQEGKGTKSLCELQVLSTMLWLSFPAAESRNQSFWCLVIALFPWSSCNPGGCPNVLPLECHTHTQNKLSWLGPS